MVIATHNRADSIVQAVTSVLNQSFTDFELIIVDDGSTDDTVDRIEEISDPRMQLCRSPRNEGVSAARNRGIERSRGTWVAFQDSDDEWLPLKLEKQLKGIKNAEKKCVASYCGMLVVGPLESEGLARTHTMYIPDSKMTDVSGDILESILRTSFISTQTMMVRRDILNKLGGFDEALYSLVDWDCALRVSRLGDWAFVDEPLVIQRFSPNSLTRNLDRRVRSTVHVVEKNRDLLSRSPDVLANHYRTIAGSYRRLGDFDRARQYLRAARESRPRSPELWTLTAYTEIMGVSHLLHRPPPQ